MEMKLNLVFNGIVSKFVFVKWLELEGLEFPKSDFKIWLKVPSKKIKIKIKLKPKVSFEIKNDTTWTISNVG